jgi:protein SCO1/2
MSENDNLNENSTRRYFKVLGLILILLFPAIFYFVLTTGKHNMISLPYYGEKEAIKKVVNGKEKIDTIYHQVPDFSFINQAGDTISEKNYQGKIYIADFIFTTCPGICPKMSAQMHYLEQRLKDYSDVMFLSHTVDPEKDSVSVLSSYAKLVHANTKRWNFVTGNKQDIYKQALYGYLVNASEDVLAPGGFLHSELFVLVDKNRHIRGFYDGTSVDEAKKLIDAVKLLIAEEQIPKKS